METVPSHFDSSDPVGPSLNDHPAKDAVLKRLRRAEGQIRGVHDMIDADRPCVEVLTQIAAVQQALRAVGRELLRDHMKRGVAHAPEGASREAFCDELVELFYKNAR